MINPCILSDHHGINLDFNNNKNTRKPTYSLKLNNFLLNDNLVRRKSRTLEKVRNKKGEVTN